MQNGINQSSLLQAHIQQNATGGQNSALGNIMAQNNIVRPVNTAPANDTFTKEETPAETNKKKTIAKIALGAAILLSAGVGIIASFRHKGGPIKSFKNLFKKKPELPKNMEDATAKLKAQFENAAELQKGADNINNAKDSLVRHFLMKIPGYKKFDTWASNLYRKTALKTMNKKYQKAFGAIKESDERILDAIKNNTDEGAERLRELIQKRQDILQGFTSEKAIKERMQKLDKSMSRLDEEAWQIVKDFKPKKLKEYIEKYSKNPLAEKKLEAAKNLQNEMTEKFMFGGLDETEAKELDKLIKAFAKGDETILNGAKKAHKLYKNAYTKEQLDMFEKLRDINYGCAPNDILSMLGTTGLLGLYTAQADTKEERVSVSLTTGIPLLATLGTTLVATNKMVSGAKALVLGLITGGLSNILGNQINKKYLEAKGMDKSPKTIVTIDDYINTIQDDAKTVLNLENKSRLI